MNAGQDLNIIRMRDIYQTMIDIRNDDFNAWIKMDTAGLMAEVTKRTGGLYSPTIINNIIQRL